MAGLAAGVPGLAAGYLLKTTVVMALALLAAAAAKRRSAAFRHFILSSALIGSLLFPLLSLTPVGWKAPLLPAWLAAPVTRPADAMAAPTGNETAGASMAKAPASTEARPLRPADRSGNDPAEGLSAAIEGPGDAPIGEAVPAALSAGLEHLSASGRQAAPPRDAGAPTRGKYARAALAGLLVAVLWAAGLAGLLLRLVFGLAGASRLTSQGKPLDGASWRALLEGFLALLPLRRPVRLKSHPEVLVPLTWGWRKPVVLFPDGAEGWSDDERSSALYHELSHIRRGDSLVVLLVRAGLSLYWWNPLCWVVYRELLKEQEIACDELVLRAGIRPSTYAASLLAFRRSAGIRWNPSAALPGMLGRSSFQERLAAILKQELTFMEVKMKTKFMVALILVAAVALVGTARPAAGREVPAAQTVLAETAIPEAAPLTPVLEAQATTRTAAEPALAQERQVEQEKAKAAEKAKEAEKAEKEKTVAKTIVVKSRGDKSPIEITITEGDQVKKLVLEHTVTITKAKDGDVLVLTTEGREPIVLKGEPLHLEIEGGALEVLGEGLEHGEATTVKIVKDGGMKGDGIVYSFTSRGQHAEARAFTLVKKDEDGAAWTVIEEGEKPEHGVGGAAKIVKGEPGAAWTVQEKPSETVWIEGGKAFAFSSATDEEMLKKVQALQEQVAAIKAKKMDLSALEESLKKLEAELKAKEEKLGTLEHVTVGQPVHGVAVRKIAGEGLEKGIAVTVREEGDKDEEAAEGAAVEERAKVMVKAKGDGMISIVLTGEDGPEGQKAFERAVSRLKKELPEGYRVVEQKYDAETGAMTFKIAGPKDKKTDGALVEKLVESLRAEIDKS